MTPLDLNVLLKRPWNEVLHSAAHRWGMAFPTDGAFAAAAAGGGRAWLMMLATSFDDIELSKRGLTVR